LIVAPVLNTSKNSYAVSLHFHVMSLAVYSWYWLNILKCDDFPYVLLLLMTKACPN